ncbi:MAG: cytochrome c3 family protein [Bryobacterales bacterium]|nr:cytochrome c3 family protein [Bryobacterales bacterium]
MTPDPAAAVGYPNRLSTASSAGRLMLPSLITLLAVAAVAQQPVGFSHKAHIEKASMQCVDCHEGAVSRDAAVIPSIRKCMLCHQFIGKDLPEVVRLTEYWERKHEVPWVRVYGFEEKAAVQFRHAPHARAEIACSQCHGDVASMTVAVEAVRHTMGTCVTCHRQKGATDDCLACHF